MRKCTFELHLSHFAFFGENLVKLGVKAQGEKALLDLENLEGFLRR